MDFTSTLNVCVYVIFIIFQIVSVYYVEASSYSSHGNSRREMLHCTLKCPNGYDTDIEGNPFCRCYDPCSNVFCPGGMNCIVNARKRCRNGTENCRPRAYCKDITKRPGKGIDNNVQSDGASSADVTTPSAPNVCSLEVSKEAFKCRRKKRRWYFDEQTGTCVKFRGCEGEGNNFSRKKFCKKQCIKKKSRSRKGRKNRRRNKTKGRKRMMASRTPEIAEFRTHVAHAPRLYSAFSAPGVYFTARCPPDKPMVHCNHDPCASCRHFYVICEINLCGQCSANYYNRKTSAPLRKCGI
ncbi:BPTI/Kunitz domain-containing protein 4-like [Liolophura sinensis]|uniref:BPTI/Kunitz domain-containing protein 4-like n=1 Tax=Liolophura sinensis TaxID=3198878 RepID=UPI00315886DA